MKYRLFTKSHTAWDAMFQAIKSAQQSVFLEMYIFLNDTFPTHNFTELLIQKAKEGVDVKLVIDALGSYTLATETREMLRKAGVDLVYFRDFFRRTHRKILVVDETVGFIGGVNIGKQYHSWLDLQMKVSGTIVRSLVHSFQKAYIAAGGADSRFIERKFETKLSRAKMQLLERWPGKEKNPLHAHYRDRIARARKSITVVTPYFIPHTWLVEELKKATARGVVVEVIVTEISDPWIATLATKVAIAAIGPSEIKFYATREMHHAKALLIDDEEGLVGSPNIDALSFDHNIEAGIFFEQKSLLRDLRSIVEEWKKNAVLYDPAQHPLPWYLSLLSPLFKLLRPFF